MTYEHDFERNKMTGAGIGDYHSSPDVGSGVGKWLLLALIAVILALGAAVLFSGGATIPTSENQGVIEQSSVPVTSPVAESE